MSDNRDRKMMKWGFGVTSAALIVAGMKCPELHQYGLVLMGIMFGV